MDVSHQERLYNVRREKEWSPRRVILENGVVQVDRRKRL